MSDYAIHHPARSARSVDAQGDPGGVDRDPFRGHGVELGFRPDVAVRGQHTYPRSPAPTVRLPHSRLLRATNTPLKVDPDPAAHTARVNRPARWPPDSGYGTLTAAAASTTPREPFA